MSVKHLSFDARLINAVSNLPSGNRAASYWCSFGAHPSSGRCMYALTGLYLFSGVLKMSSARHRPGITRNVSDDFQMSDLVRVELNPAPVRCLKMSKYSSVPSRWPCRPIFLQKRRKIVGNTPDLNCDLGISAN